MNKRKGWFWILGVAVLLIAGGFVGGLGLFGLLPWQGGDLYKDPQGRYTVQADPSWERVKTGDPYTQFKVPDPPMNMYLLVLKASTVQDAFSQALETAGFDPGLLTGGSAASAGEWQLYGTEDSAGLNYGGDYFYHDGGGKGLETTMRFYPKLDLGVVVMGNVAGYRSEGIAEGLASAWMHEK